jgi:hypothetical protein
MTFCNRWLCLLGCSLMMIQLDAQDILRQVIGAAGSEIKNGGVGLHYHIGEISTWNVTSGTISFNAGFIQPDAMEIGTAVTSKNWEVLTVYPNPSSEFIRLEKSIWADPMIWEIYDLRGNVVLKSTIDNFSQPYTDIDLQSIPAGLYILRVFTASRDRGGIARFVKT